MQYMQIHTVYATSRHIFTVVQSSIISLIGVGAHVYVVGHMYFRGILIASLIQIYSNFSVQTYCSSVLFEFG